MNSYERLMNRLQGKPVDKVPNLSILMGFAAKYAGVCYRDFCNKPEIKAAANLKCHRELDTDIVTVMSDPYVEAIDHGLQVQFPEDANPAMIRPLWAADEEPSADDLAMLTLENSPRMAAQVETIRLYAKEVKGVCPIAGWVEGALAEYCDLRGMSEGLTDIACEEDFVEPILAKITEQDLYYIKEQVKAGADIIGVGDAVCSLIGPEMYEKYGFPYEKKMVDAIHEAGALVKLHICGNTTPLLDQIAKLGVDIFDVDSMVDFSVAREKLEAVSSVCGNMSPVEVLLGGTPETVAEDTRRCLREGGEKCLISGGCETPPFTAVENLTAVNGPLYR